MRYAFVGLGLAIGIVAFSAQAQAQNYPWCAIYGNGGGGGRNCGFTTFAQCQQDIFGIGGSCQRNTLYQPPTGPHRRHAQ